MSIMSKLPYEIPWTTTIDLYLNGSMLLVGSPTGESYDDQTPYDDDFDE